MRDRQAVLASLLGVALAATAAGSAAAYPRPGRTEIASVSSDGAPKTAEVASISATGRYIAFVSADPTIVVPDTNPGADVFVHDRRTGATELVSVSSQGTQGLEVKECDLVAPAISATGRYVAFHSSAPTLVRGDENDLADVFVHDRKTGRTELVSVSSKRRQQNEAYCEAGDETEPDISISNNGRYVAFVSPASNLVDGDTNETADVFVHDRRDGGTDRISVASDGSQASGMPSCAVLNASGRYVAFTSIAPDLVPDDRNRAFDAFVHDRKTGRTEMVSVASDGSRSREGFGSASECQGLGSGHLSLSANARFVAFSGNADNLVPSDAPPLGGIADADVFVHDRKSGRTERVSVTNVGEESTGGFSIATAMSADGRFVAFASSAKNLQPDDDDGTIPIAFGDVDVFVHDRLTGDTRPISVSPDGEDGTCRPETPLVEDPFGGFSEHGYADLPSISQDGRYISFVSCDTNLVTEERRPLLEVGVETHVFLRDQGPRVGVGSLSGPGARDGSIVLREASRFSTTSVHTVADSPHDATPSEAEGAEILGATLAHRPYYSDLYLKIDLDRLPGPRGNGLAGNPAIVYGARFSVDDTTYELRAHKGLNEPVFGLFDCTAICSEVAQLKGGYGTVGESVVATIPLVAVGLAAGGTIEDLEAFSALGVYSSGAVRMLDVARFR